MEAANVALVGIRDVDELERAQLHKTGVRAFTMRDIDERGMRDVMRDALAIVSNGTAGFRIPRSISISSIPQFCARRRRTPVRGGATYREAHLAMEMACDSGRMLSMEVVQK